MSSMSMTLYSSPERGSQPRDELKAGRGVGFELTKHDAAVQQPKVG